MIIEPSNKPHPSFLLAVLLLTATGCTEPGAADDDPSEGSGDDEPSIIGTSTTDETDSLDAGSESSGSGDSTAGDSGASEAGTDPGCGNGIVEADESCDDRAESPSCDADCTAVECGDMTINAAAGEECDGINLAGATCQTLGLGGGTLVCGEACAYDASDCGSLLTAPVLSLGFSAVKQFDFSWTTVAGATHYRLEESAAPGEPFVQVGEDIVGESISLTVPLHLRYEASYRLRACNADGCTDSAVVAVMGSLAEAVGYFKASNAEAFDDFGHGLALSGDGNTLAVGAPSEASGAAGIDGDQTDDSVGSAGAVYVFVRDAAGEWSQQAYVKASNAGLYDSFGTSVALSDDGNTLAVGAPWESSSATGIDGDQADDSAEAAGAAYVFVRDGADAWSQQAYVKASNTGVDDRFGEIVALAGDGNTLAVSAPSEDSSATGIDGDQANDAFSLSGAVYVFARDGASTWSQQAYVKASNTGTYDDFGTSVALSADGDTLAIGGSGEGSGATGIDGNQNNNSAPVSGAVYVLVRDGAGNWSQQAFVKASNTGAFDLFGAGVALSDDGDTLAIGAFREDSSATGIDGDQANDDIDNAGAVYVLVRDGAGAWSQQAYIKASNTGDGDYFGARVALSHDGDILAVSATIESSAATGIDGDQADDAAYGAGAVYVFVRDGASTWSQRAYVKASNTGATDIFGITMAISSDGQTLAVGTYEEDSAATGIGGDQASNSAINAGAVYLY